MLVKDLRAALEPFKLFTSGNSPSKAYQVLQLGKRIGAQSAYGVLQSDVDLGLGGEDFVYVEANLLISVVSSLPEEEEIALSVGEGVLAWKCGASKGKIALVALDTKLHLPITRSQKATNPILAATPELAEAFTLTAISCGQQSLLTSKLYGMVIDFTKGTCFYATDNVTISKYQLSTDIDNTIDEAMAAAGQTMLPETITISPEAAELLALLCSKEGALEVLEDSLFFCGSGFKALLRPIAPISQDLGAIIANYEEEELTVKLPPERVTAFVKRATALTENKKSLSVTLSVDKAGCALFFEEGVASTEELYLVEELGIPDALEISLDAKKLARVMQHISYIVLDHIERKVLVLSSEDKAYSYLISGKSA